MTSKAETGFCIPYTVKTRAGKGRGIFVDAKISRNTTLWRHVPGQYLVYDETSLTTMLARLSHADAIYELTHMFGVPEYPGFIIRILDDGVLINHSQQPTASINQGHGNNVTPRENSADNIGDVTNALLNDRFSLIATKDMEAGDELTLDYDIGVDDPGFYDALCERYNVSSSWI